MYKTSKIQQGQLLKAKLSFKSSILYDTAINAQGLVRRAEQYVEMWYTHHMSNQLTFFNTKTHTEQCIVASDHAMCVCVSSAVTLFSSGFNYIVNKFIMSRQKVTFNLNMGLCSQNALFVTEQNEVAWGKK